MKVSLASILASSFVVFNGSCNGGGITIVSAFTNPSTFTSTSTHHVNNKQRRQSTNLYSTPKKKVLTAADVISKSKSSTGSAQDPAAPGKGEQPKIFVPQIYNTFQSTLLLLEKRISNGSGSLSKEEVYQFENEINDLINEMNDYNLDPKGEGEKIKSYYESLENGNGVDESVVDVISKKDDDEPALPPPPVTKSVETSTPPTQQTKSVSHIPITPDAAPTSPAGTATTPAATSTSPSTTSQTSKQAAIPKEQEDIDAETISKGYGLASGTRNTYAIPGMEEMTAEEYRDELQRSISARQAKRRKEALASNTIGNRSSSGYLDALGGGGSIDPLGRQGGNAGSGGGSSTATAGKASRPARWQPGGNNKGEMIDSVVVDDNVDNVSASGSVVSADETEENEVVDSFAASADGQSVSGAGSSLNLKEEAKDRWEKKLAEEQAMLAARERDKWVGSSSDGEPLPPVAEEEKKDVVSSPSLADLTQHIQPTTLVTSKENDTVKLSSLAELVPKKAAGRFKAGSPDKVQAPIQYPPIKARVVEEEEPPSQVTPAPDISSFNEEEWFGHAQKRQRPVPSSGSERKPSFFQVHQNGSGGSRTSTTLQATEASQNVSTESTTSFAHGDEANSQRDRPEKGGGSSSGFFNVHTASDQSISSRTTPAPSLYTKSLVDTETRIRPTPSSDTPEYTNIGDHRSAGDTVDPLRSRQSSSSQPTSLVQTEGRARPIPSTALPDYAKHTNHRSAGDSRTTPRKKSLASVSLVGTEGRSRPVPTTTLPEYAKQINHRSAGDIRTTPRKKSIASVSLVQTEGRSRPIPSSKQLFQVVDRRSVGDDHALTKNAKKRIAPSSLIGLEQRTRPAATTDHLKRIQPTNHRGPGDSNAMTKRDKKIESKVSSLIEGEQRARPSPSSDHLNNIQVGPHRGPGDDNAMTKRDKKVPVSGQSLIGAEQRARPSPSSDMFANIRVGDHRGPGDDNAMTRRDKKIPISGQSLSEAEQTVRPASSSSAQPHNFQVGDHRDVGDSNAMTRRKEYTVRVATSLSEGEQTVRPAATSYGRPQNLQVGDYRDIGDQRQKVQSSSVAPSRLASLSADEQRQRPVPSASRGNDNILTRALEPIVKKKKKASKPKSSIPQGPAEPSLTSLLKKDKQRASDKTKKSEATRIASIAEMPPSSLHSLLLDAEPPIPGGTEEDDEPVDESEWWNEKPSRPRGYVKHSQPLNTSYVKKKVEAPRDYGDVVSATQQSESEDDDEDVDDDEER